MALPPPHKCFRILALLWITLISLSTYSKTDYRLWESSVGSTIDAKLIKREGSRITLQRSNGTQLSVSMNQLSSQDQAFLQSYPLSATGPEDISQHINLDGYEAVPGEISARIFCESSSWSYKVYLPTRFDPSRKWPVWFIISPSGGIAGNALIRYVDGAETLNSILVLPFEARNKFADSDIAMDSVIEDVYNRFPIDRDLSFVSGFSSSSRMAYALAERNRHIQGILACGSGKRYLKDGIRLVEANLRNSTYVYSLIGTNCINRSEATYSHMSYPNDYRLRFFAANHAWAEDALITEGMARVMGEILKKSNRQDWGKLRKQYSKAALVIMNDLRTEQPWEAYYWASFLSDFYDDLGTAQTAKVVARSLEAISTVELALRAEREIQNFAERHFGGYLVQEDQKDNPTRHKSAFSKSLKFKEIPHGDLLARMGLPTIPNNIVYE